MSGMKLNRLIPRIDLTFRPCNQAASRNINSPAERKSDLEIYQEVLDGTDAINYLDYSGRWGIRLKRTKWGGIADDCFRASGFFRVDRA